MKSYRYPIKHILTLIIGIIASYYGGGKLYGQDYEIIKVTTENGLSHSTVFDITQDGNGLMWFGTREGLNRFDSNEIKTFYKEDSEGLPSNLITSLLYAKNILWVGTDKGLSKYHISKDVFEPIPQLNDSYVMNLFQSSNSEIFISTQKGFYKIEEDGNLKTLVKDGFFNSVIEYRTDVFLTVSDRSIRMTNSKGEVIKYYELNAKSPKKSQSGRVAINKLFKDSKGFIWAGTTKGLFQYDQKNDSFKKSNLIDQKGGPETKVIRNIVEDHEGNLYFGGEAGIIVVNPKKSIRTHIGQGFQIPNTLSDKAVYSLFISKNNIVWAGTYFGGVNYFKPKGNAFKRLIPSEFKNSISGKAISQMIQVENGDLWIGTEDGGISILDKKTNTFKYLRNNPNYSQSLSSDNVHALYEDFDGTIWAGTFLGGLNKIDPNTKKGKVFTYDPKDTQSISSNYIYAIYRDSKERLWIGANDGLNLFDDSTETFDRNVHPELMDKFIYDILEDRDNNLWFCTRSNGLYMLENKSNQWKHFSQNLSNGTGVCSDQFVTAYEDSFGKLWFGTMDGGLLYYNKAAESFECFGKKKGLPNNNIYGIIENPSGGLWVTTNKGLSLYNPESGKSRDYTTADGISYNQFNFKSSFMDKEGWIYFGSVNGLTYFHPDSVQTPNRTSMIFLKDFLLFNEPVSITKDSPLQFSINETKNITLEHFQNALTIEFIGVDYLSKGKNSYSYMLEGFDNSWNNVGDKKNATYTNLPFGEYEFHLKLANNEPEGSSRSLAINILPPFWKTNWAYALYFLTLTLIAYGTYYFVRFVQAKNLAVKLEKVENEKIREITKNRLNFFTFISHEFKTPLTLINAAIDQYSNKGSIPGEAANEIQYIQRSAKKLNHLVKQLMMFRKIETKHEKLNLVKGDIILYLRDTFSAFRPLFTSRGLKSSFSSNIEQYYCHFDGHKIETIISNLLSNSIKNTEGEGEISMDLDVTPAPNEDEDANLIIEIMDTDHGFNKTEQQDLFLPFYSNSSNDPDKNGTGIGLSLVKSLIDFLKGKLSFESEIGKGISCSIEIPLLMDNPLDGTAQDVRGNKSVELPLDLLHEEDEPFSVALKGNIALNQTILVVEDNAELRTFLAKHFSNDFKVTTAKNGKEAWKKMERVKPDIVVSDLGMPLMDGKELCQRIKSNPKFSHIPFLLITAQSNEGNRLTSLNAGADVFLSKPFNLKELDIIVRNLLNSTKNFEARFSSLVTEKTISGVPVNNKEREFKLRVVDLVEQNIDNPNFTIEELAKELGISRSLLHLKMKKITNKSTSDFIKDIKMQRAKELIKRGFPIGEVAYKVGFSDPNYFSRAFKKSEGMSPSSYIRKKRASLIEE